VISQVDLLGSYFFLHVCWRKKNKKYLHTTFFENTVSKLFIAARTFRVILSITAQSICVVESSAWKGILIKNITKIKNKKNNNTFFSFGVNENGITQKAHF
jgi:hypothetical protein